MLEIIALSIFLAVVAALGFRFVRAIGARRKALQSASRSAVAAARKGRLAELEANKYHAVTIVRGHAACPLSAQLSGRRFLSRDAPRLPVPGCATRPCGCRYLHHADRRADDRRFPFGVRKSSESSVATERRRGERRKSSGLVFG